MPKYHVDKNGKPAQCHSTIQQCPLGGPGEHFDSIKEAQEYADAKNEAQNDPNFKNRQKKEWENLNSKKEEVNNGMFNSYETVAQAKISELENILSKDKLISIKNYAKQNGLDENDNFSIYRKDEITKGFDEHGFDRISEVDTRLGLITTPSMQEFAQQNYGVSAEELAIYDRIHNDGDILVDYIADNEQTYLTEKSRALDLIAYEDDDMMIMYNYENEKETNKNIQNPEQKQHLSKFERETQYQKDHPELNKTVNMIAESNNTGKPSKEMQEEYNKIKNKINKKEWKNLNETYRTLDSGVIGYGEKAPTFNLNEAKKRLSKDKAESIENYIKEKNLNPEKANFNMYNNSFLNNNKKNDVVDGSKYNIGQDLTGEILSYGVPYESDSMTKYANKYGLEQNDIALLSNARYELNDEDRELVDNFVDGYVDNHRDEFQKERLNKVELIAYEDDENFIAYNPYPDDHPTSDYFDKKEIDRAGKEAGTHLTNKSIDQWSEKDKERVFAAVDKLKKNYK